MTKRVDRIRKTALQISEIGRLIGEALGTPYAFRIEYCGLHISTEELDAAESKLGKVELRRICHLAKFEDTDKGLLWMAS